MSNDHEIDKSLAEDEAFIESLYDQLPDENTSAELDQRILAAAHREVLAKPQRIKKRSLWLKPMASAAAVLLVVSVSIYQLLEMGNLQDMSTTFDDQSLTSKVKGEMTGEAAGVSPAKQEIRSFQTVSEKSLVTPQPILRKKAEKIQAALPSKPVLAYKEADSVEVLDKNETQARSNRPSVIGYLTESAYQQFVGEQAKWQYINEDKDRYVIAILIQKEKLFYYLDKKLFFLEAFKKDQLIASDNYYSITTIKLINVSK